MKTQPADPDVGGWDFRDFLACALTAPVLRRACQEPLHPGRPPGQEAVKREWEPSLRPGPVQPTLALVTAVWPSHHAQSSIEQVTPGGRRGGGWGGGPTPGAPEGRGGRGEERERSQKGEARASSVPD